MLTTLLLFAPPAPGQSTTGSLIANLLPIVLIFVVFYFFMIRPQKKKQTERELMIKNLQKGDKIITTGGAHGVVDGVEDNAVILKLAENVRIKFDKSAIGTVVKSTEVK